MYAKAHLGKIKSYSKRNVKIVFVCHARGVHGKSRCFGLFSNVLFCNAKIWNEVDFDVAVRIAIGVFCYGIS